MALADLQQSNGALQQCEYFVGVLFMLFELSRKNIMKSFTNVG